MTFNRINKVGIELEGAWNVPPTTDSTYHHDGSVGVSRPADAPVGWRSGEYVSDPMENWDRVEEWLRGTYPSQHNATCGMHVHISLKSPADYARLMHPDFWTFFLGRMEAWAVTARLPRRHLFHQRLEGLNRYCQKVFRPEVQAKARHKSGERYAQLNYAWRLHGTLECRLFPVFKQPKIAISAVKAFLQCVEDYLGEAAGPVVYEFREETL